MKLNEQLFSILRVVETICRCSNGIELGLFDLQDLLGKLRSALRIAEELEARMLKELDK